MRERLGRSPDARGSRAIEVELVGGRAKNFARAAASGMASMPVDGGPIWKLVLVADERAVARPYQPVGARKPEKLAGIFARLWPEPVAAGHLDPGAATLDRPQ